jgi:polar amino acid transport system permease protein
MPSWIAPVALYMLKGLAVTCELALISGVAALALGVVLGLLLVTNNKLLKRAITLYVELWRGLPLLVILFFAFFALPAAGIRLTGFQAAAVGLTLWASAVTAENVRGAIQAIPAGQMEVARALGFGWVGAMGLIVLPQALRRLVPPTLNLLTSLIHGTSLAAQLGVLELLEASRRSSQRLVLDVGDSHGLAIFAAVLVVFYLVCSPLTALSRRLERRLQS